MRGDAAFASCSGSGPVAVGDVLVKAELRVSLRVEEGAGGCFADEGDEAGTILTRAASFNPW